MSMRTKDKMSEKGGGRMMIPATEKQLRYLHEIEKELQDKDDI